VVGHSAVQPSCLVLGKGELSSVCVWKSESVVYVLGWGVIVNIRQVANEGIYSVQNCQFFSWPVADRECTM
jgi:hypothetical protein